jgi:hypothetical protein
MLKNKDETNNYQAFNYQVYKSIKRYLESDIEKFWSSVYNLNNENGYKIRNSMLFNNKYDNYHQKLFPNMYLENKENYELLKNRLKDIKIKFVRESLVNIDKTLIGNKYDLILLSNLSDYIKSLFSGNYLEKYKEFIEHNLNKLLNKGGHTVLAYIYDYLNKNYRTQIDNYEYQNKVFDKLKYKTLTFKSVISDDKEDAVIMN